jgi:hypothetical protein
LASALLMVSPIMKKPSQSPLASIAPADLAPVTGGGLPELHTIPIIIAGVAADNAARAWGNLFSWKKQGPGGYE